MSKMYIRKTSWEQDSIKVIIPEVNIISAKASVPSENRAGGPGGHSQSLSGDLRRRNSLRKFLNSKEHLD